MTGTAEKDGTGGDKIGGGGGDWRTQTEQKIEVHVT